MIRRLFSRNPILANTVIAGVLLGVAALPAAGQGRPMPGRELSIPPSARVLLPPGFAPPSGMCRIWIEGVPADQQPAPTDCATAVRNRPLNGKVIFSDEKSTRTKPKQPKQQKHEDETI